MSTAIAMVPSPAPHERPSFASSEMHTSSAAPPSASPSAKRPSAPASASASVAPILRNGSNSPRGNGATSAKSSPSGPPRSSGPGAPKIIIKKEPQSPSQSNTRPRPRKLDLSKNTLSTNGNQPQSARPLTARDGLVIQEVGIACLSPGFVTQDPVMKEQLQRSISVREQQRHIIESRLHQQSAKGEGPERAENGDFSAKTPGMSRRNKAPPGLSIVAPSHEQFAHERVIQSAPLGHSFTGRNNPAPLSRHLAQQPSNLSSTSHIHHVPATQTSNRLPPISDVFGQGLSSAHPDNSHSQLYPNHSASRGPLTSPGLPPPPPPQAPTPGRPREYKSAEEAQAELAGGRAELLPKLVHYGGHQPPTPPSPAPGSRSMDASRSASKRRTRAEYEDGGSPPLGHGPATNRRGPFGAGRDSPETSKAKRDEFLRICERAWDLFHS